ncbi:MAG: hypothetical protein AAGB48_06615 [Planctomycetota bacterium]
MTAGLSTAQGGSAAGTIRTVAVVTVLALLVWVVAEGESLSVAGVELPVTLAPQPSGSLVIEPSGGSGWTGSVYVEVGGSASAVTRMRDRLASGLRLRPGDPGVPTEPGEHSLDVVSLVNASMPDAGGAVSIRSIEPQTLAVIVERIEQDEIEVDVLLPDDVSASAVVAEPRRVRLTYPSSVAGQVQSGLRASASLAAGQLAVPALGDRVTVRNVLLTLPEGLLDQRFVRLDPPAVTVIATIEAQMSSITLPTVPVQVQRPAFQADRWIVTVAPEDQLLTDVTVTGPATLIEQIRDGILPIFATVRLSPDDLDRRVASKEVGFSDLPTPLMFEVTEPTVQLVISPTPDP